MSNLEIENKKIELMNTGRLAIAIQRKLITLIL